MPRRRPPWHWRLVISSVTSSWDADRVVGVAVMTVFEAIGLMSVTALVMRLSMGG